MAEATPLLEIEDLHVSFNRGVREVKAVRGANLVVRPGEIAALVGESGSGKSVTALSAMRLLPYPLAWHPKGSIRFKGEEILSAPETRVRALRGDRMSMIFQEPLTSLNPLQGIGAQVAESVLLHRSVSAAAARERVVELFELVGLKEQIARMDALPHEFSGGQQQRVMIAMALANNPDLLIADEPTTAVDVTIQAQILKLLQELQARLGMAVLFITHDLGIVRRIATRAYVMRQGGIVEEGVLPDVFQAPRHDYTRHLLASEPKGTPGPAPKDAPRSWRARI